MRLHGIGGLSKHQTPLRKTAIRCSPPYSSVPCNQTSVEIQTSSETEQSEVIRHGDPYSVCSRIFMGLSCLLFGGFSSIAVTARPPSLFGEQPAFENIIFPTMVPTTDQRKLP